MAILIDGMIYCLVGYCRKVSLTPLSELSATLSATCLLESASSLVRRAEQHWSWRLAVAFTTLDFIGTGGTLSLGFSVLGKGLQVTCQLRWGRGYE